MSNPKRTTPPVPPVEQPAPVVKKTVPVIKKQPTTVIVEEEQPASAGKKIIKKQPTVFVEEPSEQENMNPQHHDSHRDEEEKLCYHHHNQKLVYYCESCEEPICQQCTTLGPHNNQLHRIQAVQEAYSALAAQLHQIIRANLLTKRDQLLAQLHKVDYRMEEVKFVKTIIERDIRSEFAGVLERLKSAEGKKLAILQHEMAALQRDIDSITDIVTAVRKLTEGNADPVSFLLSSRKLHDNIEFTIARPFKNVIDVAPYDLPRELTEQRDKLEKVKLNETIIDFKDQVIFQLYKDKCAETERIAGDVDRLAQDEVNEWAKLTDKFSGELRRYQMICFYCGSVVDENSVNTPCTANNRTALPPGFGYTTADPDKTYHGIRRHFFSQPKPELINYSKIQEVPEIRKYYENTTAKSQFKMFLDMLFQKIRRHCNEQKVGIDKLFKDHDKLGNGMVDVVEFRYILHSHCKVDPLEIDRLIEFFADSVKKDKVNYNEFLKLFGDPKAMGEMDAFKDLTRTREDKPNSQDSKNQLYIFNPLATKTDENKYESLRDNNYNSTPQRGGGYGGIGGYSSSLGGLLGDTTKKPYWM
jgi:palmitoyltransferase